MRDADKDFVGRVLISACIAYFVYVTCLEKMTQSRVPTNFVRERDTYPDIVFRDERRDWDSPVVYRGSESGPRLGLREALLKR